MGVFESPPSDPMLRWFEYEHLPDPLAAVSLRFAAVAHWVDQHLEASAERTVALRKLLEAKDAAVRAALDQEAAVRAALDQENGDTTDGTP